MHRSIAIFEKQANKHNARARSKQLKTQRMGFAHTKVFEVTNDIMQTYTTIV